MHLDLIGLRVQSNQKKDSNIAIRYGNICNLWCHLLCSLIPYRLHRVHQSCSKCLKTDGHQGDEDSS